MRPKYLVFALALMALAVFGRSWKYGAEHQEVPEKYAKAHLAAVSGQKLLQEKEYEAALSTYEAARGEMEHAAVRADRGEDLYINYGLVLNDIGVIRLAWALYGKALDTAVPGVDPERVDPTELSAALEALENAAAFYRRWHTHNPKEYERYARALSETLANLGVAHKYAGARELAVAALSEALSLYPKNGNAERSLSLLGVDPGPFVKAGEAAWAKNKRFKLF